MMVAVYCRCARTFFLFLFPFLFSEEEEGLVVVVVLTQSRLLKVFKDVAAVCAYDPEREKDH